MPLNKIDYTIIKVVQATHHQGDVRYGISTDIQCSCMSLISVSWTLFRCPGQWDKLDLDGILGKREQFFKSPGKFRYLGIKNLPQEFLTEGFKVNAQFLENKTREISGRALLLSIVEIVNCFQQIGIGALLIVNNYILGIIWGNCSVYLFDLYSKDENGDVSSSGTAVFFKI